MPVQFSFDNALMHFARAEGPAGFLWKFVLSYLAAYLILAAVFLLVGGGAFLRLMMLSTDPSADPEDVFAAMAPLFGLYLLVIPAYAAIWAMFESAVQRRYLRQEGFSIRFGADEWRLLAVGVFWLLVLIGGYIAAVAVIAVTAGVLFSLAEPGLVSGLVVGLLSLALAGLFVWLLVRLSPAAALTIRDRKIVFISAWGASKGRFWPMFGAFLIIGVGFFIAYFALQLVLGGIMTAAILAGGDFTDPAADPMAMLASPALWLPMIGLYALMTALQIANHYVWAGPAALAARTDPRGGGAEGAAEVFS